MEIQVFKGNRADLLPLFRLADESDSEIVSYCQLGDVLAAYEDAAVIGIALIVEDDGYLQIVSLAVDAERQSAGVGTRLIAEAGRIAKYRGIDRVVVCTGAWETENIIFYLHRGFRIFNVVRDFFSPEKGYAEGRRDQVQLEIRCEELVTPSLSIRTAVVDERSQLEALQLRSSLNNPGDKAALLANPDAIELPTKQIAAGQVFVAECDGAIVGFAAVLPRMEGGMELDGLFVEPTLWRRGIGRGLVDHCATVARSSGCKDLYVVGNPHAEHFYKTCGFETHGTQETRFGPGLRMRKRI